MISKREIWVKGEDPASFVSQCSPLSLGYLASGLQVKFSGQSVRVWGDFPAMRLEDNNTFLVFEAYGQCEPASNLMFRIGRKVLSYDNQRILGEVNWILNNLRRVKTGK